MRPLPHKKMPPVLYIAGGGCFLCRDLTQISAAVIRAIL